MASETNIPNFLTVREHEEADTLLILHCSDVAVLLTQMSFFC